jgi:hypothetical protein
MNLIMMLNGQELERIPLIAPVKISEEITRLKKKYSEQIAGGDPEFWIGEVPSSINKFTPLRTNQSQRPEEK